MTDPIFGLDQFIAQTNSWNAIFGSKEYSYPLSQSDVDELASRIDSQLSPENLHCDGEASPQHVRVTYKRLTTAARELQAYAQKMGYSIPMMYEI
jgi:hypothetical protein